MERLLLSYDVLGVHHMREDDWMKWLMKYVIYGLPFVTLLAGELLAETEIDRAQVYVPLLALFPFLYLLQGLLVALYGGSLLVAVVMTSISYFVALFLFLNQSSWGYILIYLIITLVVGAIFEYKHRHH